MATLILYFSLSFVGMQGEPLYSTYVDIDWTGKYITYIRVKGGVFLGMDIVSLDDYTDYLRRNSLDLLLRTVVQEEIADRERRRGEGLIPNIFIPIKFPKPIAGLIGEGGELKISGSQRIEFGGSTTQEVDPIEAETHQRSLLPQLEMEQQLRVNLQGTVGQKIHVFIDQDSKCDFDIKNTIRLEYRGDEDEVIREITAGNTDISLPARLIGGPRAQKGLFGIRLLGELGPIDFTAIASKQESEIRSESFVGGAQEDSVIIWNTEFIQDRFFYLGDFIGEDDVIQGITLYRSARHGELDVARFGIAIDTNLHTGNPDTVSGSFILLEQGDDSDFILDKTDKIIDIRRRITGTIGFVLIYETNGVVDTLGEDSPESLTMMMLKRQLQRPEYASWNYEMKNIYRIPGANIMRETFEMQIFKDNKGAGEDEEFVSGDTTFLEYLGMAMEDGTINMNFVDLARGLIVFPHRKPFLALPDPDSIYHIPNLTVDVGRKYYIWMKYRGIQKEYRLGLNLLEGSERVVMDGVELKRGVDYDINYALGRLTFRDGVITNPEAKIVIDYQYLPFMQTASKNLLGARIDYDGGGDLTFGSTFLHHSSTSFDRRPNLGTEPTRITLGEIDARYQTNPSLFTSLVNFLPFIETDAPSSFDISFNAGFSQPNPNTEGKVYIDDMEGVRRTTSLGISRPNWSFGSQPSGMDLHDFEPLRWYNPHEGVRRGEIIPSLPDHRKNEKQNILRIESTGGWGSLLTLLSREYLNFEKSQFLEVWARGDKIIHLNIGADICEALLYKDRDGNIRENPGNVARTEDINRNGRLDAGLGEDTGLDGVMGEDGDNIPGDDGNDDYHYSHEFPDDYSRINGTEGNGRLDTESLLGETLLNRHNNYFSFRIDLSSPDYVVQEGDEGWKLYRIPLKDATPKGSPSWSAIRYARLWVEGADTIDIATMDIVGNRWETKGEIELGIRDNQENIGEDPPYEPPYTPERDHYGREEKESSLSMIVTDGKAGSAYTVYGEAKNFTQYNTLAFYIRGVDNLMGIFFIRVGGDTLNYYEYRVKIPNNWRDVRIPLADLTYLKVERDTLPRDSLFGSPIGQDSAFILGNPSLTNIKRLEIGVLPDTGESGEVWINDIRLEDVEMTRGVAASVSTSLRFADFISVGFSYTRSDPYFRRFGDRMIPQGGFSNSYRFSLTGMDIGKFLPSGISMPISGTISNTVIRPMYATGSDVVLTEEDSEKKKTTSKSRSLALSFSKSGSENRFLQWTLDRINMSANYGDVSNVGPTRIDSTRRFNFRVGYSLRPELPKLSLFGTEITYYPEVFNISSNLSKSATKSYELVKGSFLPLTSPKSLTRTDQGGFSFSPIGPIRTNYSIISSHDLSFRREVSRGENLVLDFSPDVWDITTQSISYSSRYSETFPVGRVDIVDGDSIPVRDASNTNLIDIDIGVDLREIGRRVGFIQPLLNLFTSPRFSYSISRSVSLRSLPDRPDRSFIFGLSQTPPVETDGKPNDSEDRKTNLAVSSGFRWKTVSISFDYNESERWGGTRDNKRWNASRTFPDIAVTLRSLEKLWKLSNLLTSISLSTRFNIRESFDGAKIGDPTQTTRDISLSPSLNMQWKRGISSRVSSSFTSKYTKRYAGGGTFVEMDDKSFSIGGSAGYRFTAPDGIRLPFLKHIRFSGNLDTNIDITYTSNWGMDITRDIRSKDRYTITVTPGISYNFAENITGGGGLEFRENNDRMTKMHTRTVGTRIWADFRF
ncbi:hypothetical protein LR066_02125 [candidate division WOR-3 bacterium]|nr:hypothetical protein [candidate division WOR-3 bacterium]